MSRMDILNSKILRPITNEQILSQIDELLSWAIRCQVIPRDRLKITLFKLEGWVAAPAISASLMTPIAQERLQHTFEKLGYRELFATLLLAGGTYTYTVPVTIEGLNEFRRNMSPWCYALFAGESKPDWILISVESEFDVIAGSTNFIEQFLNCEIEQAFCCFLNFVKNEPMPKYLREYLQLIHHRLKNSYQSAEEGNEFLITP